MKKFIYQIGLFVVILFIVNLLLFNLGNELYYKNYDRYSLSFNNYLFSDSHGTPLGIHTQEYNVYNFSVGADSYVDIKRKINFVIENTKVDTIYLSADEHMLSPYREQYNNFDRSSYFATINDFPTQFEYYKSEVFQRIIFFQPKMGAVIRKYVVSELEKLFGAEQVEVVDNLNVGLNWNEIPKNIKSKRIKKRVGTQFNYQEKSLKLKGTLLEIINICKTNNIVIIGVKFPLTNDYFAMIKDKDFGVESVFKNNNLSVLNFQSTYIDRGDFFYNEDHLTSNGGRLFTDVLFKESQANK